ncbi:MAG: hypothetical protein QME92_02855 [Bacillota bacterium]|nr:hypothetical protein [Bacillota bacterium]
MTARREIVERAPTPEEYRHLCALAACESGMSFDADAKAVANSLYAS